MTSCTQCRHFRNLEPDSPRAGVWYNHLCAASPLPAALDPVTGQARPYAQNDLGRVVFVDREYAFCRDVNDGACPSWEPKGTGAQ